MTFEFHPEAEEEFIEAAYYGRHVPDWANGSSLKFLVSLIYW